MAATTLIIYVQPSYSQTTVLFSPNGGVKQEIVNSLKSAQCSIDAALYSFSDKEIWKHLNEAANRGVEVRLVLNKSAFKSAKTSCKNCDMLLSNGGKVKFHSLTMHHKFSVIDKNCKDRTPQVLTGSGNWSTSSSALYDEDFLKYTSSDSVLPQALVGFSNEFSFIWNYSRSYPDHVQTPNTDFIPTRTSSFLFTSQNMYPRPYRGNWTFSKKRDLKTGLAGKKIIEEIDSAEKEVLIATAHFRRPDIFEALKRAKSRGVEVVLVTDGQEFSRVRPPQCNEGERNDKYLDECLELESIGKVFYKYYSVVWDYRKAKQMHSKYVVIDRKKVLTGSFNWSYTAEFKNLENLVEVTNLRAVKKYATNFSELLEYGQGSQSAQGGQNGLEKLLNLIQKRGGKGPCHFTPMTVKGRDILKIRSLIKRDYCR
ncbi:phosphatidylserine/phosphatidylglycerophosphate/cardiolipin synthase family protein [bacterium]|nr:phosphatidylserine/phosphatidylglycerophosphate/cardiolipin synthase family protein [bacterium]